jgi:hypothetical protein
MSDIETREKRITRLHKDTVKARRQIKIVKSKGHYQLSQQKSLHQYVKQHAMDCGQPRCVMCGNPRKVFGDLTYQEKKLFQNELYNEE